MTAAENSRTLAGRERFIAAGCDRAELVHASAFDGNCPDFSEQTGGVVWKWMANIGLSLSPPGFESRGSRAELRTTSASERGWWTVAKHRSKGQAASEGQRAQSKGASSSQPPHSTLRARPKSVYPPAPKFGERQGRTSRVAS